MGGAIYSQKDVLRTFGKLPAHGGGQFDHRWQILNRPRQPTQFCVNGKNKGLGANLPANLASANYTFRVVAQFERLRILVLNPSD